MFFGIAAIGLGMLYRLEIGLDQRMVLPKDSHLLKYYDYLEKYVSVGPPVFFVVRGGNLSQYEYQRALCGRLQNCSMDSISNILERERKASRRSMISDTPSSWIDDFFLWLNPEFDRCCRLNGSNFCQSTIDSKDCMPCLTQNVYESWLLNGPKGKGCHDSFIPLSIF
jgi:Niemann-Pick C1 protein